MNCSNDVEIFLESMYSASLDNNAQIFYFFCWFAVTGGEPLAGLKNIKNNCYLNDVYNALHTRISLLVGVQINNGLNMRMPGFACYLQWRSISWLSVKPLGKRYHQMIWLKTCKVCFSYLFCFPFYSLQVCLFTKSY